MIKAGIIGSTGYAGGELVRLLLRHPETELVWLGSRSYTGKSYADIYRNTASLTEAECRNDDMRQLAAEADVIFTATPQGFCAGAMTDEILSQTKIIDLSADYRLKDPAVYEKWYAITHKTPQYLPEAVYGLCELNREAAASARIIANPGCYTTCSILTLWPLVKEGLIDPDTIVIDAKSGTSGAGRGEKLANLFCEVNENVKAYGVGTHRHTPEIEEQLSYAAGRQILLNFTPHLIPMNRGILVTAYAQMAGSATGEKIRAAYEKYYGGERFIRLMPEGVCPETKWVEGSNFTDIGFYADGRTGRVIAMGALDNLVKGAAGQAVQNMNILFGLPEETGLDLVPVFP